MRECQNGVQAGGNNGYLHVRHVFVYLFATVPWDCYIPSLVCAHAGLYHVDTFSEPVLLSNAMASVIFSDARIGGRGDNDDQAIRVNQSVATFAHLCEMRGLNLKTALADASKRYIAESLRDRCDGDGDRKVLMLVAV